jgi:hypothetical protein
MATKKKSVKTLTGKRLLMKEMMHYVFNMGSPAAPWDLDKNNYVHHVQTWRPAGSGYIVGSTYFDLSGYSRDDLTTFPQRITVQESGSYRMKEDSYHAGPPILPGSTEFGAIVLDIITEESISPSEISTLVQNVQQKEIAAGFPEGPLEFSQIIFGRYRMFGHDTSIWTEVQGNLTLINETQWGSGSPTTVDKLWIYRIIIPLGNYVDDDDDYIICPAARYVMSATIDKENDSAYLMRQKRSYELAR